MARAGSGVIAVLLAVSASAWAQDAGEQAEFHFRESLTAADFERNYPRRAAEQLLNGRVMLCCLPGEDGRLSCAVIAEAPENLGFGPAARRIGQSLRLTEDSLALWRSRGGAVRVPLHFQVAGGAAAPAFAAEPRCGVRANAAPDTSAPGGDKPEETPTQ
ncbi:MAG: hypothetical protein AB7O04_04420 [Hyphomonadaceae bacterium]